MTTPPTAIINPLKQRGDKRARYLYRVVENQIVFIATDGEVMMAGEARIHRKTQIVVAHGAGIYRVLGKESDIRVREVIPHRVD